MTLLEQIEQERLKRSLTKTEFAELLGYSPAYYINLSTGASETSVISLQRILKNAQRL